ncbi:hypothetical protein [Sphingobium lactosutens]|uniref:hypothetical protein n=1 Tax=Sphingobium lactosutens TaxID=522773 RepID=UPI0012695D84|nr:hypothetical protein [Sphingobium lactosutens]
MKRELFLHVGHGKTGSSYIQSILSTHRDKLKQDLSILYPVLDSDRSSEGKISSGNGSIFLKNPGDVSHVTRGDYTSSTLYSSEFLFALEKNWLNRKNITALSEHYEGINVLLFVRNPDEMLSSSYQQAVKRSGYAGAMDEYIEHFNFFRSVEVFIKKILQHPEITLSVYNYSNCKKEVSRVLARWLNSDEVYSVPYPVVNRSLTYAELVFQQEVNKVFGKSGDLFSDIVCEQLPDLKADAIKPSQQCWADFVNRTQKTVDEINSLIPNSQALRLEYELPIGCEPQLSLNVDQLRIIAQSMLPKLMRI